MSITCDKCPKSFAREYNLYRHMMYSCPNNNNRESRPDYIKRRNPNAKPYKKWKNRSFDVVIAHKIDIKSQIINDLSQVAQNNSTSIKTDLSHEPPVKTLNTKEAESEDVDYTPAQMEVIENINKCLKTQGWVYLQETDDINTFKIGQTLSSIRALSHDPISTERTHHTIGCERALKKCFRKNFKKGNGNEYFIGPRDSMQQLFIATVNEFNATYNQSFADLHGFANMQSPVKIKEPLESEPELESETNKIKSFTKTIATKIKKEL